MTNFFFFFFRFTNGLLSSSFTPHRTHDPKHNEDNGAMHTTITNTLRVCKLGIFLSFFRLTNHLLSSLALPFSCQFECPACACVCSMHPRDFWAYVALLGVVLGLYQVSLALSSRLGVF